MNFSVLDVETTGLSYRNGDRICEVGVVRVPLRTAEGVERDLPRTLRQGTYKDFLKGPYVSCSTVSAEDAGS